MLNVKFLFCSLNADYSKKVHPDYGLSVPINSVHGQGIGKLVRFRITKLLRSWIGLLPSKHFLFSKMSSRCLEDVFSVTLFVFQDLLRTSSRRLQDVFAILLPKTSSRRLATRIQDVFQTSSRRL